MLKIFSAPSNIAIIKYMGKTSTQQNLPTNTSISYTLDHLQSFVTIEKTSQTLDHWQPLSGDGFLSLELNDKGKIKFLNHLQRIKDIWNIEDKFLVRSANNFPSDCGIASSSSSFAALTLAAVSTFQSLNPKVVPPDLEMMSSLSRLGSGSSCRSFFRPWALWQGEAAKEWKCGFQNLSHTVMLLDSSKKDVSSSEAHVRVTTSPLFTKRLINVQERLAQIEKANAGGHWNRFCELAFEEFQEMHQLFESSVPIFSYRNSQTLEVLKKLEEINQDLESKLLITMDAGNNIHCLSQSQDQLKALKDHFSNLKFIDSWTTMGGINV